MINLHLMQLLKVECSALYCRTLKNYYICMIFKQYEGTKVPSFYRISWKR